MAEKRIFGPLIKNLPVGGLSTDVKIAGRWGIVSGQETNTKLNQRESGHGLPSKDANGVALRNDGRPLGYTPVMTDATKPTTFDDIGSELNVFDTATNLCWRHLRHRWRQSCGRVCWQRRACGHQR